MAIFQWKGVQDKRQASGQIDAANQAEAKAKLEKQRVIVTNLKLISGEEKESKGKKEKTISDAKKRRKKVKNKDLLVFTKKFATMVQAGLPILKTLLMLRDQTEHPTFRAIIADVSRDVESGTTLSDAFAKNPKIFDSIYINLLKAGETSGKLTLFMRKLVVQIEKTERIRAKVRKALTYPVILIVVAVIVIAIMMVKVVPVFQKMFSSMGHDLPLPTQIIVNISNFLRDPGKGGLLALVIVGSVIGIIQIIKRNKKIRKKFDLMLLRIPIIKDVIIRSTLARIAMVQGNLFAAGVSILESLDIIADTVRNTKYKETLAEVKKGVSEGKPLSGLYGLYPEIYTATFVQLIAVGEETGNMDEMLESSAMYYEEEFDMVVDRLTEFLEPAMIVFMGGTIGFIIIAMYMPIFQMGKVVGG